MKVVLQSLTSIVPDGVVRYMPDKEKEQWVATKATKRKENEETL